jgi:hypothetical protein
MLRFTILGVVQQVLWPHQAEEEDMELVLVVAEEVFTPISQVEIVL